MTHGFDAGYKSFVVGVLLEIYKMETNCGFIL